MARKTHTEAQARYDKLHRRVYGFRLHNDLDSDIIAKLASVDSMQGYIKQLIREDIARTDSNLDYTVVPVSVPNKFINDLKEEAEKEGHSVSELIWLIALEDMPWLTRT